MDWTAYAPAIIVILNAIVCGLITKSGMNADPQRTLQPTNGPPGWIFSVAWLIIYILMIYSWTVAITTFSPTSSEYTWINSLFLINILLQIGWCSVYFGIGDVPGGLIILSLLVVNVAAIVVLLRSLLAPMLAMVVYLLWALYALYLNYSVAWQNGWMV